MSRCFPFPPPGYERKLRIDDGNLLAKEKDKEKKEKKHKRDKDKEKKEGKEKDKDRHRENDKDKEKEKEKKEKNKHKNKDKKKDKSRSRDERGGSSNAEKVGSNSPQSNQFTGSSSAQELGQRISYVDVATGNQTAGKINDRAQGRGELLDKPKFEQKPNGQRDNGQTILPKVAIVCNLNGVDQKRAEIGRPMEIDRPVEEKQNQMHQRIEKGVKNTEKDGKRFEGQGVQIDPPKDNAFVQELGRRIRAENGASGIQVIARPNSINQKRMESIGKFPNGGNAVVSPASQEKEISNFGNDIKRKNDGDPKVAVVQNFKGLEQRGPEMVRPADMGKKVSIGGMERNGFSRIAVTGYKEKKIKTKDEDRNKATTEKAKQGGDNNIIKLSRLGESGSDSTDYSKQHALPANKSLQGFTAKRKEPEANGFLHDNEARPSKLPRTVLSPQSNTESGRNLQQSATITLSASKQGTPNSLKPDSKELKVNGMVGAQQSPLVSAKPLSNAAKANGPIVPPESPLGSIKPPSTSVKANGTVSAQVHGSPLGSTKPTSSSKTKHKDKHKDKDKDKDKSSSKPPSPHPDSKYLSKIFSIPKIDDWSESIDQDWLFDSNSSRSKEIEMGSLTDNDEQHQVWAKAVHIEHVDVCARPYVIPL